MKRRLILFATTLGFLLLAFCVYYFLAGVGLEDVATRGSPRPGAAVSQPATGPAVKPPMAIMRDDGGRLEGIIGAESWDPMPDGSYLLTKPYAQFFQTSRRELTVAADRGTVYVEETARGLNVRRGTLAGNVRILYDRATDLRRDPAEKRPDEFIRIHLDDVQFNNDLLEMTSDSHVTVFAAEADIIGKGLTVSWNEEPAELRLLRIHQGEQMVVKDIKGFRAVGLPGSAGAADTDAGQGATSPGQLPPLGADERLGPLAFEKGPASKPASLPATQPTKPTRRNVFRATFRENVEVFSTDGRVEGAEKLSLSFEWDSEKMQEAPPARPALDIAEQRQGPAPSMPAAGATDQAQTRPGDESASEPITIVWSGPLLLEPEGHTDRPSTDHFRLHAEGRSLRLSDDEMTVNCRSFVYQSPDQAGRLTGSADRPVVMTLADGSQRMSCQAIRFNRADQLAELVGPGFMSAGAKASPPAATMPATRPATQPAGHRRIAWQDSVTARIGTIRDEGSESGSRPFISEAIFRGGIELRDDEEANFVRGDTMHLWLADGEDGPYPSKAKVTGGVTARQDDSDIVADEVVVEFEEVPAAEREPDGLAFRETRLIARGNVEVTDRSQDTPVVATADVINVTLDEPDKRRAELLGTPAGISRDAHQVTGNRIELHEATELAKVKGAGSLTFLSDRDPQGRKLDKPRPVNITWSDSMDYDGLRNEAIFKGGVKLSSGLSRIECEEMTAAFEELDAEAGESPSADEGAKGPVSFDPESFGRGELTKVVADGEVLVVYETVSKDGNLLQAMQLRSDNLTYDAKTDRIDCTGYGRLTVEDNRPPEADQPEDGSTSVAQLLVRRVQRPWQTVFEWRKNMRLMLDTRMVIMDGDVVMIHHSGANIVATDDPRIPDFSNLTTGRTSTLGCGKLMAQFAAPDERTDEDAGSQNLSPAFDPGSEVGDLQMFVATRDVVLEDRDYELRGEQLSYLREKGFAILWGYLDGQPVADAYVYSRGQPVSSPKFLCHLDQGHVKKVTAMDVTGSGAR